MRIKAQQSLPQAAKKVEIIESTKPIQTLTQHKLQESTGDYHSAMDESRASMHELKAAISNHKEVGKILQRLKQEVLTEHRQQLKAAACDDEGWQNVVAFFTDEDGNCKAAKLIEFLKLFKE